jgi:hypothetical protein
MNRWVVAGVAVLCAGVAVGLWLAKAGPRRQAGNLELPPSAPPPAPPTPVVLADVVEVANLEPLLDPRAKDTEGAPFDADPTTVPISTPNVPDHIPPATDEPAVAPMPREVTVELPLFDPSRACWYGEHRLPRQIGGGMSPDEMLRQLRDTLWRLRPRVVPGGVDVGFGVFF